MDDAEYIDTKIEVDCMIDGSGSPLKIRNIYYAVKDAFKLFKPFQELDPRKEAYSKDLEVIYGQEMYLRQGTKFEFTIYGLFDIAQRRQKIPEMNREGKYASATRMKIDVRSKEVGIAEKINEIIQEHSTRKKN
jgi:hypothetical protein